MSGLSGYKVKRNVKLKDYTTFRIGGEAECLIEVYDTQQLSILMRSHGFMPLLLGRGSNVLISDKGYPDLVIVMRNSGIEFKDGLCIAESGAGMSKVSLSLANGALSGLEWACSLPGTVGGAVKMNAGAFGGCVADVLEYADILRGNEELRIYNSDCGFSYRNSGFLKTDIILRAAFRFKESDKRQIFKTRNEFIQRRRLTQPSGFSAGSVFKAADKPAGWYIDNAGLKGLTVGGAVVSPKHANFIINTGSATAENVASLIDAVKAEVYVRYTVALEEEIEYIGEF